MALNDTTLKNAIKACFEDVRDGKTAEEAAQQFADAISAYVKSATIGPGTFSNGGGPVGGFGSIS